MANGAGATTVPLGYRFEHHARGRAAVVERLVDPGVVEGYARVARRF